MIIVDTFEGFYEMYADLVGASVLFMDTETTNLDPYTSRLLLLQVYTGAHNYVVDFLKLDLSYLKQLQFIFEDRAKIKVFHNAVFDWKMIHHNSGIDTNSMHCTMVTDQILGAGIISGYSLADVSKRRLDVDVDKTVRAQFINRDLGASFTKEELEYAALDVELLKPIYEQQLVELQQKQLQRVYALECNLLPVTASMEYTGILLDEKGLREARPLVSELLERASLDLQDAFIVNGVANQIVFSRDGVLAVNLGSHKQKLEVFNNLGISVQSTGSDELAEWDALWTLKHVKEIDIEDYTSSFGHPILKKHNVVVTCERIRSVYIDGLLKSINPVTHKIHPGFNQCGAGSTGRYSSSGPNFQNIIKTKGITDIGLDSRCFIRPKFIADPGYDLVYADFSGIELAILAILSGDKNLIAAVLGGDSHSYVANSLEGATITKLFGSLLDSKNKKLPGYATIRDTFKTINYSIIYGTGGRSIHRKQYLALASVGMKITERQCIGWLEDWKSKLFPDTGAWLAESAKNAITLGYTNSILGRKRFWANDVRCDRKARTDAMREGMNAPIQSSSADMTKLAMYLTTQRLDKRYAKIVATVHDEIMAHSKKEYSEECGVIISTAMREAGYALFPNAQEGLIEIDLCISTKYDK